MNCPPPGFHAERDLPPGFMPFYAPLTPRSRPASRRSRRAGSRRWQRLTRGGCRSICPPSDATRLEWRIELPAWLAISATR